MLQKSDMTEQERETCVPNLTALTYAFRLSKAAHLLFQGEGVGAEPVAQAERPAQREEMAIHYSFGLGYSPDQKTRQEIKKEKKILNINETNKQKRIHTYLAVVNWKSSRLQTQFKELNKVTVQRNSWQVHIWELLNENSALDSLEIKTCQMLQGFDIVQQG